MVFESCFDLNLATIRDDLSIVIWMWREAMDSRMLANGVK
jgi:hypothetical protein